MEKKPHLIWKEWNLPFSRHSSEVLKIVNVKNGMKVVDVAVGEGRYAIPMTKSGASVTGIDNSDFIISNLKRKLDQHQINVNILKQDIRDTFPIQDGTFDVSASLGTMVHIDRYEDVCNELYRVTKPGGRVIVEYSNKFHITSILEKLYQWIDLKIRKKNFSERVPIYLRSLNEGIAPFKDKNCKINYYGFYPVLPNGLPIVGAKGGIIQHIPGLSYGLKKFKPLVPLCQIIVIEVEKIG